MAHYDLIILGAGSGNMLPAAELDDWKVAIVEPARFGGTCLNRGCIPSKMFVYAADVAMHVRHAGRYGIDASFNGADWVAIRERVFGRIDPIHESAVAYRRENGIDVYEGEARFVAPKALAVGSTTLTADRVVVSVGSRPVIPAIAGLDSVTSYTSDTIMRIARFPSSLVVVGGGFIGAEMGHVFGALGSDVTIVHRGDSLLPAHDREIRARFTEMYRERFDVRLSTEVARVEPTATGGVRAFLSDGSAVDADALLLAVGRTPNTDRIDARAGGLELDEHGHIRTDATYATNVSGVWAFGDAANHFQLKHMANAEGRVVRHNLVHPDQPRQIGLGGIVPSAVFADPQVASVGATQDELDRLGRAYAVGRKSYSDTAYGWALEDTTSFAKVLADPRTGLILGAHIIGPQASTLIQPLIQAMCLGNTVEQVARGVIYIHPALTEVVENALLECQV